MNVLQVTNVDTYGSKFNGVGLAQKLNEELVNCDVCVWKKQSSDSDVKMVSRLLFKNVIRKFINIFENILSVQSIFYPFSFFLLFKKYFCRANIIHYHLIHTGFFSILSLPLLTKNKSSVWTLHDPWPMTGHCIYPYDCRKYLSGCYNCSRLKTPIKMNFDNANLMWKIKKYIFRKSKFDIVVASQFMYDMVISSPLLEGHNVHLIPFGINLDKYKPSDQNIAKNKLNINKENFVIFFRAGSSEYKGQEYIKECLKKLKTNRSISVITSDHKGEIDEFKNKFQIIDLGWIQNDEDLVIAYNACDVFLMPSTAEAFGLMAIEAMACGKPVIAFNGTSLENVICSPLGGITVPMRDSEALRGGFRKFNRKSSRGNQNWTKCPKDRSREV